MNQHGIIVLEDAIPEAVVGEMLSHFNTTFNAYMAPGQRTLFRNFQDDPKRAQIPVAPIAAMANPVIFANPSVMAVVNRMIGAKAIIGEMGSVISHPGSDPQYTHRDTAFLFGGEIDLPPHSLTITIPLLDVSLEMGPTEFWPGSHRIVDDAVATKPAPQRTALKAGSLLFYDGRLLHRGGPNKSNVVRPIVYFTYQPPWYLERPGYETKPQVRVTAAMLRKLAPEHRRLFEWALHLNRFDNFDEFVLRWMGRLKRVLGR
jgi:ectoine hydroxylase-related dioxygenase (phytanoyl-CoA dioxygenase family)